ncbi:hypothetical protein BD779DRAFT_818021 [Infundibulicybe gibba]|nr:hypothetical protein BD779DRAFT_818021 [Infundibulicybe gibba]
MILPHQVFYIHPILSPVTTHSPSLDSPTAGIRFQLITSPTRTAKYSTHSQSIEHVDRPMLGWRGRFLHDIAHFHVIYHFFHKMTFREHLTSAAEST